MKLNQLRDVVAVAARGSVHAAARQLKVTQPALTRSIHELERELGVPLFERRARGVVTTDLGQRFIERARAALSELGHAREEIAQLSGVMQGRVSVCLGVLPHLTLLPQAFEAFHARYPEVQLDITEGRFPTMEGALRAGVIDFFVGPQHAAIGKEFVVEKLYDQEIAVHCRKGHPLAKARSLRELVDAEWLSTAVTADPGDEIGPLFAAHGLPVPRLVVRAQSALTSLVIIGTSDLLKLVPAEMAGSVLGKPLLSRINVVEKIPGKPIVMIRRVGLPLTPAAEHFADMLRRASVQHVRGRSIKKPVRARRGAAPISLASPT